MVERQMAVKSDVLKAFGLVSPEALATIICYMYTFTNAKIVINVI